MSGFERLGFVYSLGQVFLQLFIFRDAFRGRVGLGFQWGFRWFVCVELSSDFIFYGDGYYFLLVVLGVLILDFLFIDAQYQEGIRVVCCFRRRFAVRGFTG